MQLGKAAKDGSRAWAPAAHVGEPGGVPGSWFSWPNIGHGSNLSEPTGTKSDFLSLYNTF